MAFVVQFLAKGADECPIVTVFLHANPGQGLALMSIFITIDVSEFFYFALHQQILL